MSDWNLEPYRFPDSRPTPAEPEPDPIEGPEETFRADLPREKPKKTKPPKKAKAPKAPKPPKPPKPPRGGGPRGPMRWGWVLWTLGVLVTVGLLAALGGAIYIQRTYLKDIPPLPSRDQLYAINRAPAIRFFDKTGAQIAIRGPKYGDRVSLSQLPDYVPKAFLAAEDKRFYQHGPVDPMGIARAAVANWRAGRVVQGGSTLSQQLAKSLFLTPDQNLKRKIQEAVMATRLEKALTKDEILELYINRTFFGANTFGIDGASRTYFGKPASQLTLSEAALLASLPKAPSRMALNRNMAGALARQRLVLNNMREENWITDQDLQAAIGDTPKLSPTALANDGDMGYALDFATNEVLKIVGPNSPDLMVRLTIDPRLQATGGNVLRQVVGSAGSNGGASQGALFAMSSEGAIRAMVGGLDYNQSVFNRAVQARRQPGSSFKPLVYAAALEKGVMPTDVRVDGPVKFGDWEPENYGGGYRGAVTIETALALSINTVAVKLAQEAGGRAISELASRFGVTTLPPNPDLSVALGAYEVPLNEMVSAFQVFQTGGNRVTPYIVDEIKTVDGAQVYLHHTSNPVPAYDIARASMMVKMMKKVIAPGGTGSRADFGRPAAGKTGTSQNWRDAWFIGFTPDYIAGVWVGNDDEKPMNRLTGGVVSAEIWRKFMMVAHETLPARDFDWLLPDPVPETEADPRNAFYDELSSDFAAAAREAQASTPETPDETQDKPAEDIPF
ncbi:multimodular transpeptidase-transglycosylase PbpC [Phenylobacterium conjunctum]|uniref:peptidoglycan glycosyltransferase n=1 Tax=Phenylobacterium conjunctum TaxID=1298959 RepID=A0ABW3T4X4_9CAUL